VRRLVYSALARTDVLQIIDFLADRSGSLALARHEIDVIPIAPEARPGGRVTAVAAGRPAC